MRNYSAPSWRTIRSSTLVSKLFCRPITPKNGTQEILPCKLTLLVTNSSLNCRTLAHPTNFFSMTFSDHCLQKKCEYYFSVDGEAHLDNPFVLKLLIEQ